MKLFGLFKKYTALILIYMFNCFPIKKNKIFLFSFYGSHYGCNPKYISEYMLNNCPQGQFDMVWAFNHPESLENKAGFRVVKTMSLKYFYEMCTSRVIITNFRTTDLFVKRKGQYYIQTWHSSLRLKQIEKDAKENLPEEYVRMAKNDSKKCDLLLSGCKYSTDIFRRSFWFDGEIFEYGTPRNDLLFEKNLKLKEKVFERINISIRKKVLLYAPTFRKNNELDVYDLEYEKVLRTLKERFGGNWVCLVKLHPHLQSKSKNIVQGNDVVDVTGYDDIQELLSISDVLITDYSSLMFDYAITKKPCFLYVPDYKEYIKQDRKLYFDLLALPFRAAMSKEQLKKEIKQFDHETYASDLTIFQEEIGSFENGKASESLITKIYEVCFQESRRETSEAV